MGMLEDDLDESIKQLRNRLGKTCIQIAQETERAMFSWPTFSTAHHGYAVILEEMDELKEHVWTNQNKRDIAAMRKEAVQLAAMCLRFIIDVCDNEENARR